MIPAYGLYFPLSYGVNRDNFKEGSYEYRLVQVFSKYPKVNMVVDEVRNLRVDNRTVEVLVDVLMYADCDTDEMSLRRLLTKIGFDSVSVLLELKGQTQSILEKIANEGYITSVNDLALSGHDIMAMGYKKESIKEIKEFLFNKVIYDISLNKKEILQEMIKDCPIEKP